MPIALFAFRAIPVMWITWWIYWWLSAFGTKKTAWRESVSEGLRHRLPLMAAVVLLVAPDRLPDALVRRWLPAGPAGPIAGAAMVAAGLAFTIWARRHLGRNWSASVAVKAEHSLTRTGPYRIVRHPIYTGILLAFLGTAVSLGEWRALLATALAFAAFLRKSRAEEARMRETFGEYEDYQRQTAALIPFVY